jgi:hypothetical protein
LPDDENVKAARAPDTLSPGSIEAPVSAEYLIGMQTKEDGDTCRS